MNDPLGVYRSWLPCPPTPLIPCPPDPLSWGLLLLSAFCSCPLRAPQVCLSMLRAPQTTHSLTLALPCCLTPAVDPLTLWSLVPVQPEQIRLLLPDVLVRGGRSEGVVPLPLHQHSVQAAGLLHVPGGGQAGQLHLQLPLQPGLLQPGVSSSCLALCSPCCLLPGANEGPAWVAPRKCELTK